MIRNKKKIIITGGSGFLGSYLSEKLLEKGYKVISLDIKPPKNENVFFVKVDMLGEFEHELLENPFGVINLAGKNIFGRWNKQFKKLIYDTRVKGTSNLVSLFKKEKYRPNSFVSASAAGFYGDRGNKLLDDKTKPGKGFLAEVCKDWEKEARKAENLGIETTIVRNGHILGKGGLLETLKPYYKWGVGGPLGSGEQWFPWIHVEDISRIYIKALENNPKAETINATSPELVRNKEFSQTLANVLNKPHIFSIPKFSLKILFSDFGEEMLYSQKIKTKVTDKLGFTFKHPHLKEALKDVLIFD